jgi:tRNA1Val (adenine37-N6)-methyltransferase
VTCAGAAQETRVLDGAARAGLVVVRRREVVSRAGKHPLFAVWAMRREGPPGAAEAPLVVRDRAGGWTAAFRAVRSAMGMPA